MKKFLKTLMVGASLLLSGFIASCDNSLTYEPNPNDSIQVQLVKTPDIVAYSGQQVLGSTFGTRTVNLPAMYGANAGDGDLNNTTWRQFDTDDLSNITNEERQNVLAAINEKTLNGTKGQIDENVVFPWENYFLQDVIAYENGSYTNAGNNGMKDVSVNTLEAFAMGSDCSPYNHHDDYDNYAQVTNSKKMNQYFLQTKDGGQDRIEQTTLMTDMTLGSYEQMKGKQFRVYQNCHISGHYNHYITVNVNNDWYICFDFGCGDEEHDKDGQPGIGATYNDWDYNDWIIKISPAYPKGAKIPDVWTENPEDKCTKCDHLSHDGKNCDQCEEGTVCHPKTEQSGNDDPVVTPEDKVIPNHVEVNLSIEERDDVDWLASHLSIHVRAITDVEVFIPIPAKYICDADDLAIVEKHLGELMVHGGPKTLTYNVGSKNVTLTIEYLLTGEESEQGIKVTTSGIDEDVIAYCKEKYNDGITFEIWNYFNITKDQWNHGLLDEEGKNPGAISGISADELRGYLNQSTIEFTNTPDLYVNAFMYQYGCEEDEHECGKFIDDCTVNIIDFQKTEYNDSEEGYHYNGSPYNQLYYKNSEE